MKSYWESFISLFFPRTCANCERSLVLQEEMLCTYCVLDLPKTQYHKPEVNPLTEQLQLSVPITQAFAYLKFRKSGMAQKLLHKLKYKGAQEIGLLLGSWFAKDIHSYLPDLDVIVPIPIHTIRKRTRGYNQAEAIADGIALVVDLPVEDILKRTRHMKTQTKKGKIDRWLDIGGLYKMKKKGLARNKHILLVDDVITTGATVSIAVQALLDDGAASVSVACLATGK